MKANCLSELIRIPGRRLVIRTELDNGNLAIESPSGFLVGSLWWRPSGKVTVHLEHLEISEDYQKQGLGEVLLREFLRYLPKTYPNTKYLTGNVTSQGIFQLLRKVFGSERNGADITCLPKRSPKDWPTTRRRVSVRFRAVAQSCFKHR
jgi:ribosomal protein S18 acetylase RimI-like enzyme